MMTNAERSVVVDPVLCYVSNHRRTVSDQYLHSVISRHFAASRIADAFELLRGQTVHLLIATNNEEVEEIAKSADGNVESILRIFRLCDRYGIDLPEFAVVDLSSLPPPPTLRHRDGSARDDHANEDGAISFTSLLTTSPTFSIHGHFTPDTTPNDALFTHQMLARIVQELKQLKSLVIDYSQTRKPEGTGVNVGVNVSPQEYTEEDRGIADATTKEKLMEQNEDRPDSVLVAYQCNSPSERTSPNEEHKSPSRGSAASATRVATMTPPRKRGSSRSSSSIEDAVAKIKAQIHSGVGVLNIGTPSVETEDAEPATPEILSPKMEPADLTTQSPNPAPPNRNNGDSLISSLLAAAGAPPVDHALPNTSMANRFSSLYPAPPTGVLNQLPGLAGVHFPFYHHQPTVVPGHATPSNMSPQCDKEQQHTQQLTRPESLKEQIDDAEPHHSIGIKKKSAKRQHSASSSTLDSKKARQEKKDAECSINDTASSGDGGNDSDKRFVCTHDNCNKRFANKFLLKKHEFIHTGLRPYQCPYCFQRCNRKDNLLRHKLTHEKNFSKPRRRSCRVFGVKRDQDGPHSDVVTGSAAFSPSAGSGKDSVPERSASCAPSEREPSSAVTAAPATFDHSSPATPQFQQAAIPPEGNFPLAVWASYMAQSLWSASNLGAANSLNN